MKFVLLRRFRAHDSSEICVNIPLPNRPSMRRMVVLTCVAIAFAAAGRRAAAATHSVAAHASAARVKAAPGSYEGAARNLQAVSKDLRIYFVDVEGGQSTLFVTPAGDSLLVDTGWPDNNRRDADRIVSLAKKAGVRKIDYVVITHFHTDHVGGVPQLVARIPVGTFIDHGKDLSPDDADTKEGYAAYEKLLATGKYKHIVAHPGEIIPIRGMRVEIVSADGNLIATPLPGAGESNAGACAATPKYPTDQTENRRSVGMVMTFGKLRISDFGDLTHDEEAKLMCPVNKIGRVSILVVSHHGWDHSSSPALIWGIRPRVAVMDNGETKGGSTSVLDTIQKSPGLENLWQLHYSDEGGAKHNAAPEYIANLDKGSDGNYIEVTASAAGSFSVFNSRTGKTKEYPAR
ncbi:MAG: ComEC/Rec2 family competence protein [Candidatus Acidiferrales bacterium]